ncbi:LacI family DNA-binding transcriptional regulator [Rhodospirillum sp. A1_3_36]|uniref:LacI family DNA-binding transcriptional regulator n=1 Tax=Rhodospirillum sp. A1_3_36 TaxID=3391666 RepID=UPI0039A6EBC9
MVTIKDVAFAAGVSGTTVSHVINGTRYVAPETAERVNAAISRLGFAPNGLARALKGSRTKAIGMVVTSSTNPFFAALIHGVERACFARGYSLILCNSEDNLDKMRAYREVLRSRRIDALVLLTANQGPGMADDLATAATAVPTIALDAAPGTAAMTVADDSALGGRLAMEYLADKGFRSIALITGPAAHARSAPRLVGALEVLAERRLSLAPEHHVEADLSVVGGHAATLRLLSRPRSQWPQAIFCFNDVMAMGALSAAQGLGLSLPGDLSVLGYDDIELAAYTAPPLTTIHQPVPEMGEGAVALLIDYLEKGHPLPEALVLPPTLVERASVGTPREP